jgi:hypothetical protein
MAKSQALWGIAALEGKVTTPAWKSQPSFYLVATEDGMIARRHTRGGLVRPVTWRSDFSHVPAPAFLFSADRPIKE